MDGDNNIVALNEFWNNLSKAIFIGRSGIYTKFNNYVYNNTVTRVDADGDAIFQLNENTGSSTPYNWVEKNNLFILNSTKNIGKVDCEMIGYRGSAKPTPSTVNAEHQGSMFYSDGCSTYYRTSSRGSETVSRFETAFSDEASNNTAQDSEPVFTEYKEDNPNLGLPPGHPAIDAGVFITNTTDSGTGTTITLADAGWIFDRTSMVANNLLENLAPAEICIATYCNLKVIARFDNQITINTAITWAIGDKVSLEWSGEGPDVGANEGESAAESPMLLYDTDDIQ